MTGVGPNINEYMSPYSSAHVPNLAVKSHQILGQNPFMRLTFGEDHSWELGGGSQSRGVLAVLGASVDGAFPPGGGTLRNTVESV